MHGPARRPARRPVQRPARRPLRAVRRLRLRLRLPLGSPLQLLLLACSFALAGYAGVRLFADDWPAVALWFVGSALLHDLVLLPLYALVDRAAVRLAGVAGRREWLPYLRAPALLSVLLLLVWFPLISGRTADRYRGAAGLSGDGFLARWLLVTAALFGVSALLLVARSPGVRSLAGRSPGVRSLVRRLRRATKERPPTAH